MREMLSVLVFTGFYLPGYKGGGPIRTIANMLSKLEREIQFYVVTADRDLGDTCGYPFIDSDCWTHENGAGVYYASPSIIWPWRFWNIINNFEGDALHLNSFFSFRFSVLPLNFWRVIKLNRPVIIGPRGEFSQGAMTLKSGKKRLFVALAKAMGLYRNVIWHASTNYEAEDIRRVMGNNACVRVAVDIACPLPALVMHSRQAGCALRIIFVSRISPKKNLLGAINMLRHISFPVIFDVYGPVEDEAYWVECKEAGGQLPKNVRFQYCGVLSPVQVPETMAQYDLFYLPTLGENFGHVIAEAFGCGLPVLISDTTPWRHLARQKLGWDIPLEQPRQFLSAIESCYLMPAADYDEWRHNIRTWALANIGNQEAVEQNRQLFVNLDISHEH